MRCPLRTLSRAKIGCLSGNFRGAFHGLIVCGRHVRKWGSQRRLRAGPIRIVTRVAVEPLGNGPVDSRLSVGLQGFIRLTERLRPEESRMG